MPSHLSAVEKLAAKGKLIGGEQLQRHAEDRTRPVFPEGAPSWYPEFSNAVYTNLHAAATGSMSVWRRPSRRWPTTANKLAAGS